MTSGGRRWRRGGDSLKVAGGNAPIRGVVLQFLSLACAATVLSGYLIQPLLSTIGKSLGLEGALLGSAPALIQFGIALGVLFLLPLGDRISNRRLACTVMSIQVVVLLTMGFATRADVFLVAAFLLGLTTITPYLLPAYVSHRVEPERLGAITGVMSRGVTSGILAARICAPLLVVLIGWRNIYLGAAGMILLLMLALSRVMSDDQPGGEGGYFDLLGSLGPAIARFSALREAAVIQGLMFGSFNALWIVVGLQVGHTHHGDGRATLGALGALAVIAVIVGPTAGRFADRLGAHRVRALACAFSVAGWLCLISSSHIVSLVAAIVLITLGGVSNDIANRSILMRLSNELRTRLLTVYTVTMFICGAVAAWLATTLWDTLGWTWACAFGVSLTGLALTIALVCNRPVADPINGRPAQDTLEGPLDSTAMNMTSAAV